MDVRKIIYLLTWIIGTLALNQNAEVDIAHGYDPGECSQNNQGELKLVQDRLDNDRLLICSRNNYHYVWQRTDGSSTYGEYFNPGFDCSDILNHDANARDGFYWINLNEDLAKQVWCDMTTDGGGFMLIGHKTSPVTWTVPSNYTKVDPFTSHQWSSSLGNSSIMDFRIQISTTRNFSDTKAHWLLRLRNKRPLKELMVLGKGGCDSSSPGIGDVALVKDLRTERIVTYNFRCSKFGIAHSAKSKIGWTMMNTCLTRPCNKGFAFLSGVGWQLDHSGAYSYSASGQISGIDYQATAFVGCDRGQCCACFGPRGGTGNYCTQKCQAINGGTVVKHINTWFWVRSTLPQRAWRRCMEYKIYNNGQWEWFKLIGDNANPVEGRCGAAKEPTLNDGVVLVPDWNVLNKVPRVSGLLAFKEDDNQLYLRTGASWYRVSDYRQLSTTNNRISGLLRRINDLEGYFKPRIRLVGGGSSKQGRVEVFFSLYGWGTVCDDYWDINDGHVVCRQLGFSRATAVYSRAHYGRGSGEILLDDVACTGNEDYLWNCPHRGWKYDNCNHSEDASVDCV